MIADLDTLLIALYVELTDRVIPAVDPRRRGPGRPLEVTDAELVCLAVAQVLLRYNDERHWLRAAADRVGHLFPRLLSQSEYNQRLKDLAPLMEAALGWLAAPDPGVGGVAAAAGRHAVGCGQSPITAKRSGLFGYAGYGYESSHSRYYCGVKLLLICTAEGTVTGFGLANPKLVGEQEAVRQLLGVHPSTRPPRGSAVVTDKGLAGEQTEEFFAGLGLHLVRPARKDEHDTRAVPQLAAPARRGDHLDPEPPARPGRPRRPRPPRPVGPHRPTPARPQRHDLAQLGHRRPGQALLDRLRSLTADLRNFRSTI